VTGFVALTLAALIQYCKTVACTSPTPWLAVTCGNHKAYLDEATSTATIPPSQYFVQAAVQAVAKISGQSGVDYLVNNAGAAGPPVPAHEEYELVRVQALLHLSWATTLHSANAKCLKAFTRFQVHILCILACMCWTYMCTLRRYGARLGHCFESGLIWRHLCSTQYCWC
jgi:hypothetical protein